METAELPRAFPPGTLAEYQFVVILSRHNGQYLLSRNRSRSSWEMQGGHIEPGETPEAAARRELFEESGALAFEMNPLCDYQGAEPGIDNYGSGMVFTAEIQELGPLPESEVAETRHFDSFPDELTYPMITQAIFNYISDRNSAEK